MNAYPAGEIDNKQSLLWEKPLLFDNEQPLGKHHNVGTDSAFYDMTSCKVWLLASMAVSKIGFLS